MTDRESSWDRRDSRLVPPYLEESKEEALRDYWENLKKRKMPCRNQTDVTEKKEDD